MDEFENDVNASSEVNVEPQIEQVSSESVNAESGEVATPIEKPAQSVDDNAKYAQVRREAESKARDKVIAEMGYEWNGQPITTYEQYSRAKTESEEQARREQLADQGIDPSIIDEYVSNNPTVKWAKELQQKQQEQEKNSKEYSEFLGYFKKENGRDFDSAIDNLPQEVWDMKNEGKPLKDAYVYHLNSQLKTKLSEYENKLKAVETNQVNANSTPGSVTGNGNADSGFITSEAFESKKHDQKWVIQNLTKIQESRAKW